MNTVGKGVKPSTFTDRSHIEVLEQEDQHYKQKCPGAYFYKGNEVVIFIICEKIGSLLLYYIVYWVY